MYTCMYTYVYIRYICNHLTVHHYLKTPILIPTALFSGASVSFLFLGRATSIARTDLEFTLQSRLTSNMQQPSCLSFATARIIGMNHNAWLPSVEGFELCFPLTPPEILYGISGIQL